MTKLNEGEIREQLKSLPLWELLNGKLHREFVFTDFRSAFSFMTGAALVSEKLNHHPEWSNVYNRVVIDLISHDVGAITERDLSWAKKVDALYTAPDPEKVPKGCC